MHQSAVPPVVAGADRLEADQWGLLTPAETAFDLFLIVPIKCAASFRRGGRRDAAPVLVSAVATPGGADLSAHRECSHD